MDSNDILQIMQTQAVQMLGERVTILGCDWQYNQDMGGYESRGNVYYDDEHDEMPDPWVWDSAKELIKQLNGYGVKAYRTYSEKGWVEVIVNL